MCFVFSPEGGELDVCYCKSVILSFKTLLFLFTVHYWVEKSETSSENVCVLKLNWKVTDSTTRAIQKIRKK